ncbi:hypothetical protein KIH74_31880 [Kineosporia sp. J2-2]|uniref:Uncharacterized protein n=1 Tax=Kineosporia corallincola TaxID=2835133 RepID=A0ABS5TS02_9ACTN|nr:hypothetical protein [Kineosporia corallincola]MBT0773587.1 hypothetical protein [Kineosporia corallincola]
MAEHAGPVDEALVALVDIAEAQETASVFEPGVMLTINGLVISGTLVASWRWAELMDEVIRPGTDRARPAPAAEAALAAVFASLGDEYRGRRADRARAGEAMATVADDYAAAMSLVRSPEWIHLAAARLLSGPDGLVPEGGILWRGRLAAVDGWSLGRMQHSGQDTGPEPGPEAG